jgi:hypothetical protein
LDGKRSTDESDKRRPHHAGRFALDQVTTSTIDGVTLVQWYDQLSGVAIGTE